MIQILNYRIICAFPGTGKSYLYKKYPQEINDSDSSHWSWKYDKQNNKVRDPNFPLNYVNHIQLHYYATKDLLLVSSHDLVRSLLLMKGLPFIVIYPNIDLKEIYMNNYIARGNDKSFIEVLNNNWTKWIEEIESDIKLTKYRLSKNEYLSDLISIVKENV